MGYDVNDVRTWHQKISEFSEFAKRQDAEFDLKRFPNGKELLTVGLYYRPRKEFQDESRNR